MKPSKLLTLALDHLAMKRKDLDRKAQGICQAVAFAKNKRPGKKSQDAYHQITRRINERLGWRFAWATSWLRWHYPDSDAASFKQIQQWRRAWMLDMIEEWKREGK